MQTNEIPLHQQRKVSRKMDKKQDIWGHVSKKDITFLKKHWNGLFKKRKLGNVKY